MTREEFNTRFPRWEHLKFEYSRWVMTHENYDCSWEGCEDGWVDNGLMCEGSTLDDLAAEIEAKEAEMTSDSRWHREAAACGDMPVPKDCQARCEAIAHTQSAIK